VPDDYQRHVIAVDEGMTAANETGASKRLKLQFDDVTSTKIRVTNHKEGGNYVSVYYK
jgi:hypothetical protein